MCVHHTKDYRRGLLRLEFEARGAISGWIGKSGSDEGGIRPDQEGQQKIQDASSSNVFSIFKISKKV